MCIRDSSLGLAFHEEGGRVVLRKRAGRTGAAMIASGGRLKKGMALLKVNDEAVADLSDALSRIEASALPLSLSFESLSSFAVLRPDAGMAAKIERERESRGRGAEGEGEDEVRVLDVSPA